VTLRHPAQGSRWTQGEPLHHVELHQTGCVQNLQRVAVMGTSDLH
jgi:hypothetical protein